MSYTDKKITQAEINAHHVQGATDYLIGNPQQNKAVFDNLPEFIAGKFNDLIDEIAGQHGDEIKVAVDEWLAEHPEVTTTVQDNSLTTAKYVDGSVTPAKLDRTYTTPNDLSEVNANLTNEINVLDARMDEFASLPEGSTSGNAELVDIRVGANGIAYPSAGDAVRGQVADLKSDLTELSEDTVHLVHGKNLFNKDDPTIKTDTALVESGAEISNQYTAGYFVTGRIPVDVNTQYVWNDIWQTGGSNLALCFYDSEDNCISAILHGGATGLWSTQGRFTTPANTEYIKITGKTANLATDMLVEGAEVGEYEPYKAVNPVTELSERVNLRFNKQQVIMPKQMYQASFSSGSISYSDAPNLKQKIISFDADCSAVGSLTISNGKTLAYQSGYVVVTDTYVSVRRYTTQVESVTENHNLDLTGHVSITIVDKADQKADIIVAGKNGKFQMSNVYFEGCNGAIMAEVYLGNYTNVRFNVFCREYKNKLWAFGDSYFDMWPLKLPTYGADLSHTMWDGHSGRNSTQALASLTEDLKYNVPEKMLWCLGMNDPDTDSAVNSNWETVYDSVVAICEENDIELILTTIPNTPTMEHTYKNDVIKASGFRYVDVASAVGATESGSPWFTGLLSADNVHPTDLGRFVIASAMIANVPEMY